MEVRETMPDYGEVIKYLREKEGYKQIDVAAWSGVAKSTVARIERTGRGNIEHIEAIFNALGYTLEVMPINGRE